MVDGWMGEWVTAIFQALAPFLTPHHQELPICAGSRFTKVHGWIKNPIPATLKLSVVSAAGP
jgi:hypothetical protein